MTKPFSLAFRQKMVARLTGKDAVSARQLALETGLRQQTLSRWLQEASSLPIMPAKTPRRDWSIEEKIRVLAAASTLMGGELADFLRREGVLQADYEQWRVALGEEGRFTGYHEADPHARARARAEGKGTRRSRRVAGAQKKVHALEEDEDDDTDEKHEP